ncbi:PRI1, partial [Enterospora canceri]
MQQGLENDKDAVFKKYYTTIFPYNEIFRVLNINENKELAFGKDSGTFIRYETFCNANDFYRRICQVIPYRIDVGSTFKNRPTKYDQNILVSRQLVFDIDLTDYDRKCCKEKKICAKCYDLIKCAIEVLSHILKKEFGFDQFGFVFSGRRGVHCWVFGEDDLDAQVRTNIFKYFDIVISRNFLESEYERILQKYAGNTEKIEDLLKWFPKI